MPEKKRRDSANPRPGRSVERVDVSRLGQEQIDTSTTVPEVVVLDEQLTGAEKRFLRQAGITITSDPGSPGLAGG